MRYLILGIVVWFKVGMLQCLCSSDALLGIVYKHLGEQIYGYRLEEDVLNKICERVTLHSLPSGSFSAANLSAKGCRSRTGRDRTKRRV